MTLPRLLTNLFSTPPPTGNEPKDGLEDNPPRWPCDGENTVLVITPDTQNLAQTLQKYQDPQETITTTSSSTSTTTFRPHTHFTNNRTVILFAPGQYQDCAFQVGYYTQVLGLGANVRDVQFIGKKGGPYCPAYDKDCHGGSSLDTFWRCAENFTCRHALLWAVSQAAPLRRIHAQGDLILSDGAAYASGGHLANAQVDGDLVFGSQQQFLARSVGIGNKIDLCAWSTVLVDCTQKVPPASESVTVHVPTVTVEKPYLVLDQHKRYKLHVPQPRFAQPTTSDHAPIMGLGPILTADTDDIRDFSQVYVAKAKISNNTGEYELDKDVARKINMALKQGKDVVLSPGIFYLSESVQMMVPNQVLLGIGMATLVAPTDGNPCIQVPPRLPGIRVAGIMLEASRLEENMLFSKHKTASLMEWGVQGVSDPGVAANPGVMSDVFARVGGSSLDRAVSTNIMIRIHSGHVLGDNLWLWRADHVELGQHELPNFPPLSYHQTLEGEVPVQTGLEVNGDNVTIHGLAVEHTTEHQVIWNGENGCVQFYQCELPYDVSTDFGLQNYMGYKVNPNVRQHNLGGAGVYSNFRDGNVLVKSAIEHPHAFKERSNAQIINPFTVHLNNQGVIMTVLTDGQQNGGGPALPKKGPARFPPI